MSQIPSPQPVPVQPVPVQPAPPQSAPAEPFVPNPSESALLWLIVGIAALFVGYLVLDAIIQRVRKRRVERKWKKQARQATRETAEAQEAARPLSERKATELPPRR
jgi:heme exporter protein D